MAVFLSKDSSSSNNSYSKPRTASPTYGKGMQMPSTLIDFTKGYFQDAPKIIEHKNYTELVYQTHVMPSTLEDSYLKIPSSVKMKYRDKERKIKLVYQCIDWPEIKISYDILYDCTRAVCIPEVSKVSGVSMEDVIIKSYPDSYSDIKIQRTRINTTLWKQTSVATYDAISKGGTVSEVSSEIEEFLIDTKSSSIMRSNSNADSIMLRAILKTLVSFTQESISNNKIHNIRGIHLHTVNNFNIPKYSSVNVRTGQLKLEQYVDDLSYFSIKAGTYWGLGAIDNESQKLQFYQAVIPSNGYYIDVVKVSFE